MIMSLKFPPGLVPAVPGIVSALHATRSFGIPVINVAFSDIVLSPDGRYIIGAWEDGLVRVWNGEDGRLERILEGQHLSCALCVSADGNTLFSCGDKPFLIAWDLATGRTLWEMESNVHDMIFGLELGDSPNRLVSFHFNYSKNVWDIENRVPGALTTTEQRLENRRYHPPNDIKTITVPEGEFVVSLNPDTLKISMKSGNVERIIPYCTEYPSTSSISPSGYHGMVVTTDGHYVITSSDERVLRIWELSTGKLVRTLEWDNSTIGIIGMTADGKRLAAMSNGAVRIWDLETGEPVLDIPRQVAVNVILHQPDTDNIIVALSNGEIRKIDLITGDLKSIWTGHTGSVYALVLLPGGNVIVSGGSDSRVIEWDIETGQILRQYDGHSKPVSKVAASPDGRLIAAGLSSGSVWIWDRESGKPTHLLEGNDEGTSALVFFPDSKRLLVASWEGTLCFWDVRSGIKIDELDERDTNQVDAVFVDSGKRLLICFYEKEHMPTYPIEVFDPETCKQVGYILEDNSTCIKSPFMSSDERWLAAISGKDIVVYSMETEHEIRRFQNRARVTSLAFIPGKPWLVSGDEGGDLIVWDLDSVDPATEPSKDVTGE